MSKYTINDVKHIIPVEQTQNVKEAIEEYLNNGTIPPYDPCQSCEPNYIRKLISKIQNAEAAGTWPPKKAAAKSKPKPKPKPERTEGENLEGGYTAGIMSLEEMEDIKAKRPEMFEEK